MTISTSTTAAPLIVDHLNAEWNTLATRPVPSHWRLSAPFRCATLGEVVDAIAWARRHHPGAGDDVLIDLLTRRANGDDLAGRVVLQAMLGRAVNLARRAHRVGAQGVRGDLSQLMAAAVAALWNTIATYPVLRRTSKVPVNICMDALAQFTSFLDDHAPDAVDTHVLDAVEPVFAQYEQPAAVELLTTLAWGIDVDAISRAEASLLTRVYCPAPGREGGAQAAARELGLTPTTVRQRCSRAVQKLATAVRRHEVLDLYAA